MFGLSRRFAAWLLLLAWVPATAHCCLERVVDSPLLHCVPGGAADHHDAGDCETDACAAVESGNLALSDWRTRITPPIGMWGMPPRVDARLVFDIRRRAGPPPATPPDSINRWHFLLRAAPPARAPDLPAV
ncbi:MAG: hypothetical protein H7A45_10550 [Verrucomicrobiales bacterium]|nr:hypothetical protein [Verrucomicrobiales bacterium]